jgi:hypothetical protein
MNKYILDYYKDLIDVVIIYKHTNNYNLDETIKLLPDDDCDMINLIYHEY